MDQAATFRRFLEELDVAGVRAAWSQFFPHLEQPADDAAALVTLHMARTAAETIAVPMRAYSHAWLVERGHRSLLPDGLKASAERLYPRVVEAVGISVNFRSALLKDAAVQIRWAMENAVLHAEADGKLTDSAFVSARMAEARQRETRALFGRLGLPSIGG